MKAMVIHEFGGPEVMQWEDVPTPIPGAGQVLVQVRAVSVNRVLDMDVQTARGQLWCRPPVGAGQRPLWRGGRGGAGRGKPEAG